MEGYLNSDKIEDLNILKNPFMVLQKQTNSGLTYGQILATIAVIITLFGVGLQANLRMNQIEVTQATQQIMIDDLKKGRADNAQAIKELTIENKNDHKEILIELKDFRKELLSSKR